MSADRPWWHPEAHADRRPFLTVRSRIKAAFRAWFAEQGFTEVEPGILQTSPGNEAHLHAFRTELVGPDLTRRPLYLHTSPELACKKLLAAGEEKIFALHPCSAIASAAPCTPPSSPCSNGTAPARRTRR